jgi:hypothetical protein
MFYDVTWTTVSRCELCRKIIVKYKHATIMRTTVVAYFKAPVPHMPAEIHKHFFHGATANSGPQPPHSRCFTIKTRHTTLGRTPLYEWSARRTNLHLTTHSTHKRQISMPPAGFEPGIPANERPSTVRPLGSVRPINTTRISTHDKQ